MHQTYVSEWEDVLETEECQLIRNKIPTVLDMRSGVVVNTPINFCAFIMSFFVTLERKLPGATDAKVAHKCLANEHFVSLMYANYREKIDGISRMEV